ncbi:MAG: N-acetylmuramoyl-L-alanine amidase, partial [Candidatus Obscuribacterales bacterium]|nr:N-acetylmuramoyl-L-alanine amidase [Candidatus Obscuribacterales bacterium]
KKSSKHARSKKSTSKKATSKKSTRSKSRHHTSKKRSRKHYAARRPNYAYPYDFFLMQAPEFDKTPLPLDESCEIARDFARGTAEKYPARTLVRAGVVKYFPLKGGIFWRREQVKYLIMHSTETGRPIGAQRVIDSWNGRGRRHPGAQYVVDRDGTIFQAVDPDLATVHINIFKTLPGINNDNSIGIEMCHAGSQDYPPAMLTSVIRLVNYLQERYDIKNENVITHRYAQQGDHTDPVNFDWDGFISSKNQMRKDAIAYKMSDIRSGARQWIEQKTASVENQALKTQTEVDKPASSEVTKTEVSGSLAPVEAPVSVESQVPQQGSKTDSSSAPPTLLQLRPPIEVAPGQAELLNPTP